MTDQCSGCFFVRTNPGRLLVDSRASPLECHIGAPAAVAGVAQWPGVPAEEWCGEFSATGPSEVVFPLGFYGGALSGDYQILNKPRAVYEFTQSVNLANVLLPIANEVGAQAVGTSILVHCQGGSAFGFYIALYGGATDAFMSPGMWAECTLTDNSSMSGSWRIRYFPNFAASGWGSSDYFLKTTDGVASVSPLVA